MTSSPSEEVPAGLPGRPVFIILPGVLASQERMEALRASAESHWPEARIEVPDYLSRWRGVRDVGTWLERWSSKQLDQGDNVFLFAFILGAAALPFAPSLMAQTRRLVVLRSRYQEAVPRTLRRRFGFPLTALLFGRAVADLGKPPFWPREFSPSVPALTFIETRATRMAERMGVQPLSNGELGVETGVEVAVDHDHAYSSTTLMKGAVAFLKDQGPIENGKDLGINQ